MPTVAPTGDGQQPAVQKIDGGTVIKGGNVASDSPMTNSLSLADIADDFGQEYGSRVIAKDGTGSQYTQRVGVSGAKVGGLVDGVTQLGYDANATEWVVQAGNVTTTLAGEAYTGLIGGAADIQGADPTRDSTNELETTRDVGQRDIDVLAVPSSGINSWVTITGGGSEVQFVDTSDGTSASNDKAANTTRAVPGQLTYMYGGKNPLQDDYKAKDAAEG